MQIDLEIGGVKNNLKYAEGNILTLSGTNKIVSPEHFVFFRNINFTLSIVHFFID